jgi:small-conductance mechanosensitive channel
MDLAQVANTLDHFFTYPIFTINQTPITLSSLTFFVFIMGLFWILNTILRRFLRNQVLKRTKMPVATQYTLSRIIQYVLLFIGTIIAFQIIGVDLSGLAVIFGFLSVGIGFGLQNLTSNFIAGLMLLFEQHIKVGDRITVGDTEGDVTEINIRSTTIRSLNNIAIVVPNSEFISSTVINWSHGDPKTRLEIEVGVSYNSDLDKVMDSLLEAANEHSLTLSSPAPKAWLMSFGDSAWNMRLLAWVGDPQGRRQVQSDINCAIVKKFRQNGALPLPLSSVTD